MNDKLAQEILMMHADALSVGTDVTELLASRYPDVGDLFGLAREIQERYEMVDVSAEFCATLLSDLLNGSLDFLDEFEDEKQLPSGWVMGAAIGSAVTGIAVLLAHRFTATRAEPLPTA